MPLPEGYYPRKGDEVLIRARAKRDTHIDDDPDDTTACYLEIVGKEHQTIFMPCSGIHSLYCRKWNLGDRVRTIGSHLVGEVVAAHDEYVWVKVDKMGLLTVKANELEAEPQIAVETTTEAAELLAGLQRLSPPG